MTALTVIDTDILIDVRRGMTEAADYLDRLERSAPLAISVITEMELLVGCRNKAELHATERFLERFLILKLTEPIVDQAVALLRKYRLSHGLLIADSLIAATAIHWGYALISKNQRDFKFISELAFLPYP